MTDRYETLTIDEIVPYWRNPRVITDESVNAVAESLRRYGYQQPIVVDENYVIVMGHTRYAAMRRLGVTEAQVRVVEMPAPKIKQLRLLDNRTHEYTSWDFDGLVNELEELDDDLMRSYFPEVVPEPDAGPSDDYNEFELFGPDGTSQDSEVEFVCPSCFHEWTMDVEREAVMSGRLEVKQ